MKIAEGAYKVSEASRDASMDTRAESDGGACRCQMASWKLLSDKREGKSLYRFQGPGHAP